MSRRSISIEIDDADNKDSPKIRKEQIAVTNNFTEEAKTLPEVKHHSPND